jgi:hypothetical protein
MQLDLPFGAPAEAPEKVEEAKAAAPQPQAARVEAPRAVTPATPVAKPGPARAGFRVIQGGGQRVHEKLQSRDAVVRVLVEAGADLLLRRISPERAEHIEKAVDHILYLFDRVDDVPQMMPVLQRKLDDLEALMTETRSVRRRQG